MKEEKKREGVEDIGVTGGEHRYRGLDGREKDQEELRKGILKNSKEEFRW